MTRFLTVVFLVSTAAIARGADATTSPAADLSLWYRQPAAQFVEALPVGNGRLGAMVYGGIGEELIKLNTDTLWSGEPYDTNNYAAFPHLAKVRELVFAGKYKEADTAIKKLQGPFGESFMPLGNLHLKMAHGNQADDYRRDLNLDSAIARVSYRIGEAHYTREVFSSAPDKLLVVRLECDRPGRISLDASMDSLLRHTTHSAADRIVLQGRCPTHANPHYLGDVEKSVVYDEAENGRGMRFEAQLQASVDGGRVTADADGLHIRGAQRATILLAAATSFNGFDRSPSRQGKDPAAQCEAALAQTAGKTYAQLREAHVADHRGLFRRVKLDLGGADAARRPTDERIQAVRAGADDPQLAALFFQYGRYLLIASSRPGSQPANLQGLWNESIRPPWSSNWTTNINTQMNYWPAEVCNLAECHLPLFDLIDEIRINGRKTAMAYYHCHGWASHHNADLWAFTSPVGDGNGSPQWANWPMAGGWLCRHLWEHYLYSGDREFLARRAYPVMKESAEFVLDFLVPDKDGHLVTCPSVSPENMFDTPDGQKRVCVSAGSTIDMCIARELFGHCIEASHILGVDAEFAQRLEHARAKLLPMQVGRLGQLQEWWQDWDSPADHNGHTSHLYGLYPSDQITLCGTPALAAAAARSLELRGEAGGWPAAWRVNLQARLENGERAHHFVERLLKGTSSALLNSGHVYQIDGNFGGTAGIAEMLLQSHGGQIHLLPALPKAWPRGEVTGLRARGGFEVDIAWKDGRLVTATIRSTTGKNPIVRYGQQTVSLPLDAGQSCIVGGDLKVR